MQGKAAPAFGHFQPCLDAFHKFSLAHAEGVLLHGKSKPICNHLQFQQTSKSLPKHLNLLLRFRCLFKLFLITNDFNCHDSTSRAVRELRSYYYLFALLLQTAIKPVFSLASLKTLPRYDPAQRALSKSAWPEPTGGRNRATNSSRKKKITELKGKPWVQDKVRPLVL